MAQNGVPAFHLNLSEIAKAIPAQIDDLPPIPTKDEVDNSRTIQPARKRPGPTRASIARKGFAQEDSESSDSDFDDLIALPVGKAVEKVEKVDDDIHDTVPQMAALPDLEDNSDDERIGEKSNINILYDFLLTPEQFDEPPIEWTFSKFVKSFAKNEANNGEGDMDDEEEDLMYEEEEDYDDDDDDDDESL